MILQTVKELEAKIHFLYIDKCHNSVINYQNAYAKFEWNPFINTCYRTETKCRWMDVCTTDGGTDGRTDTRTADMKT